MPLFVRDHFKRVQFYKLPHKNPIEFNLLILLTHLFILYNVRKQELHPIENMVWMKSADTTTMKQ